MILLPLLLCLLLALAWLVVLVHDEPYLWPAPLRRARRWLIRRSAGRRLRDDAQSDNIVRIDRDGRP